MHLRVIRFATFHPKTIFGLLAVIALTLGLMLPSIRIDTDPENMLAADQPDRLFNEMVEKVFSQHDLVVVGVVNETDDQGIYNQRSLAALHEFSRRIEEIEGVVTVDLLSLPEADNIRQGAQGELIFEWMMSEPPTDEQQANAIRLSVERLPMLLNTLVSGDGKAAAIYVPIDDKAIAYRVSQELREIAAALDSGDDYHITGLPVAEVTFGHDMFLQMGISAPLAGLMIMILMWMFFRNLRIVAAPMIVAMVTVIVTMGLLIGFGFTVHIMSSMIPIFLMPIAVVDSVHILSEFADAYRSGANHKDLAQKVTAHLFRPMLLTSLTSAVGFASLMLTPIPPVQIFGGFVSLGVLVAFVVTILFVPAYLGSLSPAALASLGRRAAAQTDGGWVGRSVRRLGAVAFSRGPAIVIAALFVIAISVVGLTQIEINDNPVRWFKASHEIRIADRVLNKHFAGTYDAFLVLEHADDSRAEFIDQAKPLLLAAEAAGVDVEPLAELLAETAEMGTADAELFGAVTAAADDLLFDSDASDLSSIEELMTLAESFERKTKYFLRPDALQLVERLQEMLAATDQVGKVNALTDVVKVLNRELRDGDEADYRLPDSANAAAQLLIQFQSSHRPQDLWHLTTPDYRKTALWLQLSSGDNREMTRVLDSVDQYIAENPLPEGVTASWAGKTYINVVWQQAMVSGMLKSLLGAFAFVFFMMLFLFRSLRLAILAMIPLSATIIAIYGLIGWVGKDYDMPIAVLSSLTLGLSVDFAIHFIERFRSLLKSEGSFSAAAREIFEEPGRAIARNAFVIALGFTPLFLAPLVPYITVGAFMTSVMAISGLSTLVLLPAVIGAFRGTAFPGVIRESTESTVTNSSLGETP